MRWLVLLLLAIGCGGRAGGSPTSRDTAKAANRFERVHRLIDQYDAARFLGTPNARAALGKRLGLELGIGPRATDRVIAALLVAVDRVLAADRLHAGAQAARTLLEFDAKPPAIRADVLQRIAELKAIARGGGPMAANARLRLAAYCWRALDDATRAPWRLRPFALSHCLYALYDSDPDAYFARDPDRRPPLPAWRDLVAGALSLSIQREPGFIWVAHQSLTLKLKSLDFAQLPVEPEADIAVPDAQLYEWTPVLEKGVAVATLREQVQGDGRAQVALRLWPEASGELFEQMVRDGLAAGATEVQLLVSRKQTIAAPPGDYWHRRPPPPNRAAVIPVSLAPLGASAPAPRAPYPVDFSAGLALHLVIDQRGFTLLGRDGQVATVSDAEHLVEKLVQIRSAFPDQQALALVVARNVTFKVVIAAAAAAARRNGAPFFRLGLAAKAPAVRGNSLARRVALRSGASVAVVPDTLAARKPALLACYQDAVEKAPKLAGTVRLEPKGGAARVIGAADRRLAACATAALGKAVVESGATSAEVTFRLSGSR